MKKIIVTPAGRKRYLEILIEYLKKQKNDFDEYHLWVNTTNEEDINYMLKLESEIEWVKTVKINEPINGNLSICKFFKEYTDSDTAYLRLDDDIVYIENDAIKEIFNFRINNPEYFLVYGNIINNSVITHIHQRIGAIPTQPFGLNQYACWQEHGTPAMGWVDGNFASFVHENFITDLNNNDTNKYKFKKWILSEYQRVSINVISWLGSEFSNFNGEVGSDEEQWLSVDKPKMINKPNIIFGEKIFSHYAFFTQREIVDNNNFVNKYREIL